MKLLFTFCEGHHDVAFLTRILTTFGYTNISKTLSIKDYPPIISQYFINNRKTWGTSEIIEKEEGEEGGQEINLKRLRESILLPNAIINQKLSKKETPQWKEDWLILIYAMGG